MRETDQTSEATAGLAARRAALALLSGVLLEGRMLSELTADAGGPLARLAPEDRARAQRLALSVLRHLEQAEAHLDPYLRKTPPAAVKLALCLAVVEVFAEGAAAHGAVNAAVALVRKMKGGAALAGLTNAVLRKAVAVPMEDWQARPASRVPGWLRASLVRRYGKVRVAAMEAAQALPPPLDLTPRDPAGAAALAETLGAELLPTGSLRLSGRGQVSELPGYAEGAWWVQDAAAALAARMLAPEAGARVLDLCAAPGGKTLQLAAMGAKVTALDISGPRMARLAENLARCGLTAETVVADALHWEPEAPFDAILLDAPCSATGTIRRHPDLPFVKDGLDAGELARLQEQLIDRACEMLRPGGVMVFCTCSLLWEEGEGQLAALLERHSDLVLDPQDPPGVEPEWQARGGGLRLRPDYWPERGGMDGFFMARLRKTG